MKKLLEFIVSSITQEKVRAKEEERGEEIIYTLNLPKDKVGRVIGKEGRVIRAIKKLIEVKQIIDQNPKRFFIKVEET